MNAVSRLSSTLAWPQAVATEHVSSKKTIQPKPRFNCIQHLPSRIGSAVPPPFPLARNEQSCACVRKLQPLASISQRHGSTPRLHVQKIGSDCSQSAKSKKYVVVLL